MNMSGAVGTALPVASGRESLRYAWSASRSHRLRLVLVAVLGVASATAGLVGPATIGYLVDQVQAGKADLTTLLWMLGIMLAGVVLGAIGSAATIILAGRSYHAMLADLRERLVDRAMHLPQGVIERAGTGDLVSRSSDDVAQIADAAPQLIPAFAMTGFTIAVTLAGMTALDWWYGLALLIVLPVYVATIRWYLRTGPRIYQAERTAMSGRAQQLIESQRGYATVLGLALGEHRHQKVLEASWSVVQHSLRAQTVQNMFFGRLNIAEYLGVAAILATGYLLLDAGQSSIGAVTAAVLLFLRLFGPINQLLFVVDTLQSAVASLNRIIGVAALPTPAMDSAPSPYANAGGVRVDRVSFSYDGQHLALDEITLRIAPGERVAVVGASGAGKTTLGAVIVGIHPPHRGTIARPERSAVLSQEVHVFAGTLRENLTLARPEATDEQVHEALRLTGATGLLEATPDGLDTPLGDTGHEPTAAQAQQLALARLMLADPELAILDEATAEAGSADAGLLDQAATAATEGRAAVVIAHRLSQAAACDRILVMDAGRIIEEGTHHDLVAVDGVYSTLWADWDAGRQADEGAV